MIRSAAEFLPRRRRAYVALRAVVVQKFGATHSIGSVTASINHGRWVADCSCKAGMAIAPQWPLGLCLGCGAEATVTWPGVLLRAAIVLLLRKRPEANRNWLPGETLAQLRAENVAHGIGVD